MKKNRNLLLLGLFLGVMVSCTDDFNEINVQPDALAVSDVSAKFFVTSLQKGLFKPPALPLWYGQIFHQDQYAGQHAGGHSQYIWDGNFGWEYASWLQEGTNGWLAGYNSSLTAYMNLVGEGGVLENDQYYAIGLIMKGLYYQLYTDQVGMIPYSEASDPETTLPKYDEQIDVYRGVISELSQAISTIGNKTETGQGIDKLAENDVLFNGNMQNWKQLANSLKLRMGLRAHGAAGEDFAATAISEAISSGVLADSDALFTSFNQVANIWVEHCNYGDIFYGFGEGGQWKVGEPLVNALSSTNDPRLSLMSKPSAGGTVTVDISESSDKQIAFLKSTLDNAGLVLDTDYTWTQTAADLTITMAENTHHIGLPLRLSANVKGIFNGSLFSNPVDVVINKSNDGGDISPSVVMTAADSHFMIAEAIVKGLASGDAAGHYQIGLEHAMSLWGTAITDDFANSEMGTLTGSNEEKLEKIATQRWIANYTNGYEAWAIVRDSGYPTSAITTSSDNDIRSLSGAMNGAYANRLRYISSAYTSNAANVQAAVAKQGADIKTTKLWWAK
ncbi:MAG: SusD/RagB family nutrient-binding outer membrane lipoprotein [Flavobacteriaceae bacterium]|nr:SusD/RagB family nutrient-binding outer membrane lipoprotein [Flavobacteriaceae bacterium]